MLAGLQDHAREVGRAASRSSRMYERTRLLTIPDPISTIRHPLLFPRDLITFLRVILRSGHLFPSKYR
jgi:hypothetical protein